MAVENTLTGLFPVIYRALDVVSRELVGFIPAVARNSGAERAALNESVTWPVTPQATAADNTPGVTPPNTGAQTFGSGTMTISKSRHVPVSWTGEQKLGMQNAGTYESSLQQQFEQAFRTLGNEMESDLAALAAQASRAYGTAGTAPFGTANDLTDAAGVRQILDDNGAPQTDLQLVLGSPAMFNVRGKQSSLFKVNEAGSAELLRTGMLGAPLHGFAVRSSGQLGASVTKGTGAGYLVDLVAGYAVGDTTIHVDTGTGTILAGDIVTFAGDANKYIVTTGFAGDGDGDIVIAAPGLRATLANDVAMTIGANHRINLAFHRDAIQLATRFPASAKDSATDRQPVTDPITGIQFEIAAYPGYLTELYHVRIAWGVSMPKPAHTAMLLG